MSLTMGEPSRRTQVKVPTFGILPPRARRRHVGVFHTSTRRALGDGTA